MRSKVNESTINNIVQEARGITHSIINRAKKDHQVLVLVNGTMGSGKSYGTIRLIELFYERGKYNKEVEDWHIIRSPLEFTRAMSRAVKEAKTIRGTQFIIEEASVLFNSRRSQAGDNVSFNSILDTARTLGFGVWLTFPLSRSVDSHIRKLASHRLEFEKVYRKEGFSVCKVRKLQHNTTNDIVYPHYIKTKVKIGNRTRVKDIARCWVGLPKTPGLIERYEKLKREFITNHFEEQLRKSESRERKKQKEIEKNLTGADRKKERDKKILEGVDNKTPYSELAKKLGISKSLITKVKKARDEE